jgi:hypothetical protein
METGQFESLPEIIECDGCGRRGSWPNISGAKFTGMDVTYGLFGEKKYIYTFNNLGNNKVTFRLELNGREFGYLNWFKIVKITTKK